MPQPSRSRRRSGGGSSSGGGSIGINRNNSINSSSGSSRRGHPVTIADVPEDEEGDSPKPRTGSRVRAGPPESGIGSP